MSRKRVETKAIESRPTTNNQAHSQSSIKNAEKDLVWPIPQLIENEHFYMENGFMVFTERYHLARGRCCGNACRHCPYDHINVRERR